MTEKAKKIVTYLKLSPHPEGGFFRETYRSKGVMDLESPDSGLSAKRNFSTCIYFLLTSETFSAFHRICHDEIWHFYDGSPVRIYMLSATGEYSDIEMGRNIEKGEVPQFVIPGGTLFAAEVLSENDFTLVGCTVSPGFDYRDFELPDRNRLISEYPQHKGIITRMTRLGKL